MQKRHIAALAGIATGLAGGLIAYGTRRSWLGSLLRLGPARFGVQVTRGIPVEMSDGVALRVDHYAPIAPPDTRLPTVLVRTPYDRRLGFFYAQRIAERGYHVIKQDVRGRFGSEGQFEPFANEQKDGLDTLAWLQQQSWFDGTLGMWGASYVGYVQWAIAVENPPALKAIAPIVATSRGVDSAAPPGVYPFELLMRWILLLQAMDSRGRLPIWNLLPPARERLIRRVLDHLPMEEAGKVLLGEEVPALQDALTVPMSERYLRTDVSTQVTDVRAPVCFISGWYDIFLQDTLADYAALRSAGKQPHLTIGPWHHMSRQVQWEGLRQGLAWFEHHLKGQQGVLRKHPVCIYILGANEWRALPTWPPPARDTRYFLQPEAVLHDGGPKTEAEPARFRYDPALPTPSLGGPVFMSSAGPVDNRPLESRPDVLVFTTPPLAEPITVVGPVHAELFVRSSLQHTDFFARLCDVHPGGRSTNLCDGILRLEPGIGDLQADGSLRIVVNMWATAHMFREGHAIRLQISSGAHPRFDRNLGTGELPGKGVKMQRADQTVYMDQVHPSALILPVMTA